ncbi:MAG: hypothetical protein A2Y41_09865 [Spirochaetes bacterium GWB1_36_13]|nr:MAG: hypothetical protein A2Y41_09865 [Spirochaetes bacterium GWB1_36_13]
MKKLFFVFISIVFLILYTGCGSKSGKSSEASSNQVTTVSDEVAEAMPKSEMMKKSKSVSREMAAGKPADNIALSPVSQERKEKDKFKADDETKFNTEAYDKITENQFQSPHENPLSTFSIDVDTASYANMRRFINQNMLPPKDAVRIEELVNYFKYTYPQPTGKDPFSVNLESGVCPWNEKHYLIKIGLQGKEIQVSQLPSSNLVFLLDVSGSMSDPNKLPLLKKTLEILVGNLRKTDRVAIVVYAGAAGVVLESTPGNEKEKIMNAFNKLNAGGSTAGGEGIELAYKIAKENFIKKGNNRIILATDGDFNIGASSDAEMVRLIEKKREEGIFLTVLGFGMGNYKDSKMEKLSNAGNGNYAYIDNILEAKKVMGVEIWGTLFTIAKDVKIQIEFNPAKVKGYRLIGYENRMLKSEDFNDDKKDAGEIGSGHTVTAVYEIIPASSDEKIPGIDELKYQKKETVASDELLTIKFRYKKPDGDTSILMTQSIKESDISKTNVSENFQFVSAVIEFGLLLRDSEFKGTSSFEDVIKLAKASKGQDNEGYRAEFIQLVEKAMLLKK